MKIRRFISKYNFDDENVIEEIILPESDINWLSSCFKHPASDHLLYGSYRIGQEEYLKLKDSLEIELDLDNFEYFLEASSGS